MPRYILPTIPFLCLLAGWGATRAGRGASLLAGAAIIPLLLAHVGPAVPGWESNRGHLRGMEMNRKAAAYLEEHHPEERVLARWPLWQLLCDPIYGYVRRPISVVVIGNTERFKWYCEPGRYLRVPREMVERLGAEDFDLVWMSRNDAEVGRYAWLEQKLHLREVASVEHEGMQVLFYAPSPGAEGSSSPDGSDP
jgi:hypothetical protein